MVVYLMTDAEMQLAEIIWDNEPLPSGELVKLAAAISMSVTVTGF